MAEPPQRDAWERVLPKRSENKLTRFGAMQAASEASGLKEELELLVLRRAFHLARTVGDGPLPDEVYAALGVLHQNVRPSSGKGRVHVEGHVINSTSTENVVYRVTRGKVLWMTSALLSMEGASSILAVHDGPDALQEQHKFAIRTATPANSFVNQQLVFPEPKDFRESVVLHVHTGTPSYTFDFTGYEEPV